MNITATLQNIVIAGAMLVCILTGHEWWALAFLPFVLIPKSND